MVGGRSVGLAFQSVVAHCSRSSQYNYAQVPLGNKFPFPCKVFQYHELMFGRVQLFLLGLLICGLLCLIHAQFTYITNADNTVAITGYTGPDGDITVPATIADHTAVAIGDQAFLASTQLT